MTLYANGKKVCPTMRIISRNIGEIVQSTIPLTDAGLHLLDGSVINGSGLYSAFVTYIAGLYNSGDYTAIFDTEANWQTAVTTYGVCGKFVYDSVNNTVRLPLITGFTEGTIDPTTLGDLTQAGLPNITGYWNTKGMTLEGSNVSGAFTSINDSCRQKGWATAYNTNGNGFNFDASLSNPIYGNSDTVQPQSIKVLYYIVVATIQKTDIEVDIDEIATDLNGKVDKVDCVPIIPITETYVNGDNWYKIYAPDSTGHRWCEEGGVIAGGLGTSGTVAFLQQYNGNGFGVVTGAQYTAAAANFSLTPDSSLIGFSWLKGNTNIVIYWRVYGYINASN